MEQNSEYSQAARKSQHTHRWMGVLLGLVLVLVVFQAKKWFADVNYTNANPRSVVPKGNLAQDEKNTIELFKRMSPSVVYITSIAVQRDIFSFLQSCVRGVACVS